MNSEHFTDEEIEHAALLQQVMKKFLAGQPAHSVLMVLTHFLSEYAVDLAEDKKHAERYAGVILKAIDRKWDRMKKETVS